MTAMLWAVSGLSAQRTQHSLAMFMRGGTCQPKRCCMAVWWSCGLGVEPGGGPMVSGLAVAMEVFTAEVVMAAGRG